jgi:hypothetical protein
MMAAPIRSTLQSLFAGLALFAAGIRTAVAQDPSIPPKVLAVAPGTSIRVTLRDGTRLSGRLDQVGSGRLGISSPERGLESVPVDRLASMDRKGNHAMTGLIVGGITGVLTGALVGTIVRAVCDAADCDDVRPYAVAIPIFGAAGALLGTGVGALFPRWRRVWP